MGTAGEFPGGSVRPSRLHQGLGLLGWLVLSFSAALTGALVSTDGWYAALQKPTWNPPPWVFGPVWSALYLMMGVAAWLVWREGGWRERRDPLVLFVVQWGLNAAWTPIFFRLHNITLALVEIALLWLTLAATTAAFFRVRRWAGALLLPYLAWVTFAGVLTFTLWRLNAAPASLTLP